MGPGSSQREEVWTPASDQERKAGSRPTGPRERNFTCARDETGTACFKYGCGVGGGGVGFAGGTRIKALPLPPQDLRLSQHRSLLPGAVHAKRRDQPDPLYQLGTPRPPPHPLLPLQCLPQGPAQGRVRRQTQVGEQDAPIPGSAFHLLPPGGPSLPHTPAFRGLGFLLVPWFPKTCCSQVPPPSFFLFPLHSVTH